MKTTRTKKLKLERTTLRVLAPTDLRRAGGGAGGAVGKNTDYMCS